ncbi:nucleoside diphosphate-linked moiety X motif 19-like [Homarus americanus]|uniref:nucleoside diphosphate-linked moiety X motif 19-like n=1 Tax=Homarus americanus TaxID=6706 RepID=UPI001C44B05A|nr:nucleoside diphosphate-linked moiety X motif 19-like [Homarus americanus]
MAGRHWREAASLIIVGQGASVNTKIQRFRTDYDLLFLKRSGKSSFLPNAFVFPGGVTAASDFSQDWLNVFKKCGYSAPDLKNEFRNPSPLPEIYANKPPHYILPEVGFRITAIRETFEECGLLLATHHLGSSLDQHELEQWRKAVHNDPSKFLAMFQELGGCPAVWDLHEWIDWFTPINWKNRRFDTAFYITFIKNMPKVTSDNKEIAAVQVSSPAAILDQWHRQNLMLPPPQVYEVSRLLNFQRYEELKRFACKRGKLGLEQYFPVWIKATDGIIAVLPGDDMYPEDPDYLGEKEILQVDFTMKEMREAATHLNRLETKSLYEVCCVVNIEPKYGHASAKNFAQELLTSHTVHSRM